MCYTVSPVNQYEHQVMNCFLSVPVRVPYRMLILLFVCMGIIFCSAPSVWPPQKHYSLYCLGVMLAQPAGFLNFSSSVASASIAFLSLLLCVYMSTCWQDLLASMNSSSTVAGGGSLPVPNRVLDRVHLHVVPVAATDESVSSCNLSFWFF